MIRDIDAAQLDVVFRRYRNLGVSVHVEVAPAKPARDCGKIALYAVDGLSVGWWATDHTSFEVTSRK